MIRNKIVLAILLIDFAALNLYAAYADGFSGLVALVTESSPWGWVLMADVVIALGLVLSFMFRDAKNRGEGAPVVLTVVTMLTGSIGPLIYLLKRPSNA